VRLAIIVPVLDEAASIVASLQRLTPLRSCGARVIVVDGGSSDSTVELAGPHADVILRSSRGRATQMNAGARVALDGEAEVLLFLHADSVLPESADRLIESALNASGRLWGRFDVFIDGKAWMLKVVAPMMNLRSRVTGICTGDQAIFLTRTAFEQLSGFAPIALMEDIELSKRARRLSRPVAIAARVTTSGRRWERHGVWRTIGLMWRLRLAYFLGADPQRLAERYRNAR